MQIYFLKPRLQLWCVKVNDDLQIAKVNDVIVNTK